jgi:hypothetical protein
MHADGGKATATLGVTVVDDRSIGMSKDPRLERSRAHRTRRRRPRLALVGLAALVLLAGIGAGIYEGAEHWGGGSTLLITDATAMSPEPASTGDGWTRLPFEYEGADVTCLAMDLTDPEVLYAGTADGRIFKSTDAAGSWKPVLDLHGSIDFMAIDPNVPQLIYALGTTQGGMVHVLMRTKDGGTTWSDLSAAVGLGHADTDGFSSGDPLFDTTNTPSRVYIFADGTWKSKDGGDHWSKAADDELSQFSSTQTAASQLVPLPRWVVDEETGQKGLATGIGLVLDPRDSAVRYVATMIGVFKSTDGGGTWKKASNGIVSSETASVVADPFDEKTLYAATPMGIFKSSDRGASWKRVLGGGADADDSGGWWSSGSIVVAPSAPETLYARTSLGLFRSDDGGGNWVELAGVGLPSEDAPVGVNDPLLLVGSRDPDTVFVQAIDGIHRSVDGGRTFARVIDDRGALLLDAQDPGVADVDAAASVQKITGQVYDPSTPGTVYLATVDYDMGRNTTRIRRSTDYGTTWQDITGRFVHASVALAVSSNGELYAATGQGLFRWEAGPRTSGEGVTTP